VSATCPRCGQPIEEDNSGYCNVCRRCGAILQTPLTTKVPAIDESLKPSGPLLQQRNRGLLWLVFWFLFLGAPFTPFIYEFFSSTLHIRFRLLPAFTIIAGIAGGAVGAGFILARLYSRSTVQLVTRGILFSLGIMFFYASIAFVGCVVLMKALKNV